ncbi:hypothetical protein [uncultured Cohaesibacter sp.]|uniref:hypothetical protein n=1 Tax=uncultured Cohaesibacter sp. TaxID=1002546 RepID=UPI003747FA79
MSTTRKTTIALGLSGIAFLTSIFAAQAMAPDEAIEATTNKLHLTDIRVHYRDSYGQSIRATLAGTTGVEIDLDLDGRITEIQGLRKAGFPEQSVRPLLPEAVINNPSYPEGAHFHKLELKDGYKLEMEGYAPGIREFKAEFRHDGTMLEMKKER